MQRLASAVAVASLSLAGGAACGAPDHPAARHIVAVEGSASLTDFDDSVAQLHELRATVPTTTAPEATALEERVLAARASRSASSQPRGDVWSALARCESGMRNDTGAPYYGYFQFSPATWQSLGYSGLPHEHDFATQLAAAQRLVARSGWGQFPACARKLGLR